MKDNLIKYFELVEFAARWYPNKKFKHASRVAAYAFLHPDNINDMSLAISKAIVGLAHDLLEDTDAPRDILKNIVGDKLMEDVDLLINDKATSYDDYIKNIISHKESNPIAFNVKSADIIDHMQHNKLKKKSIPFAKYLFLGEYKK